MNDPVNRLPRGASPRGASPRGASPRAFTLVEMCVVVTILGVAALLAIPMLGSTDATRLSAAARRVLSDLTYAQNLAVTTARPHLVRLGGVGGATQTVELLAEPPGGGAAVAVMHPVDPGPYRVRLGDDASPGFSGIRLVAPSDLAGPRVLGFDELGGPVAYDDATGATTDLVAPVLIVLRAGRASGGPKLTIRVEPVTGEMSVE